MSSEKIIKGTFIEAVDLRKRDLTDEIEHVRQMDFNEVTGVNVLPSIQRIISGFDLPDEPVTGFTWPTAGVGFTITDATPEFFALMVGLPYDEAWNVLHPNIIRGEN